MSTHNKQADVYKQVYTNNYCCNDNIGGWPAINVTFRIVKSIPSDVDKATAAVAWVDRARNHQIVIKTIKNHGWKTEWSENTNSRFSRAKVTRSSCCLLNRPSSKRGWWIQRDAMTLLNSLSSVTTYPIIKHYYKSTTESGSGRLHADPLQTSDIPPFTWTMQHPLRFAFAAVEQAESFCLCSSRQMTTGSLHV